MVELNPISAIMLYGKYRHDHPCYAMTHKVRTGKKGFEFEEGQAVCVKQLQKTLQSLVQTTDSQQAGTSFIPANVIAYDPLRQMVAWHVDGSIRPIFFKDESYIAPWPNLLLISIDGNMFVYALKKPGRPTLDTEIFHAPLFNIYDDGDVCKGTSPVPKSIEPSNLDAWERIIFDSKFTHTNGSQKRCKRKCLQSLWESLQGKKKFPASQLISTNKTIGQLLSGVDEIKSRGV